MKTVFRFAFVLPALVFPAVLLAQEVHDHPAPEKLGTVSFATTCRPETRQDFNRAVALLHSFTYKPADEAFDRVLQQDPRCAIALWGRAMTHYHQLWDVPPSAADAGIAKQELEKASALEASDRERAYIRALSRVFNEADNTAYATRAGEYEQAMRDLAASHPTDVEAQVFFALALLSNASPADKEHRRQKEAAGILEPLFRKYPDHPGIPHYLIHACDNQELAARGLPAARVYAGIAPSAPHALHMPSHIFTRLGLWNDSIASNLAARDAARLHGDTGEQLHAMDYLVYAYLQAGRDEEAAQVIGQLKQMEALRVSDFKVGYAATAMPVRYVVERQQWDEAQKIADPPEPAQPQVVALAAWARGIGFAHRGQSQQADKEAATLHQLAERLRASGNLYWAAQVDIMQREVAAWSAQAANHAQEALARMGSAADDEDAIEKLPVTPGPVVPAREQLGELLLAQGDAAGAANAFQTALRYAPGRRGALRGAALARQGH